MCQHVLTYTLHIHFSYELHLYATKLHHDRAQPIFTKPFIFPLCQEATDEGMIHQDSESCL